MPVPFTMRVTLHQRSKLTEMIEKLWAPEHPPIIDERTGIVSMPGGEFPDIHWFELCMTALPNLVLGRLPSEERVFGGVNGFMTVLVVDHHPIDYLHHEFLMNGGSSGKRA
jgi:hypothetical protein